MMRAFVVSCLLFVFVCSVSHFECVEATFGVDVSSAVSTAQWKCLKGKGVQLAIVRAWQSTCHADQNAAATVGHAHAAGIPHVDVYFFPSYSCGKTPEAQIDGLIGAMGKHNYGRIWLDVETGAGWSKDPHANLNWLQRAAAHAAARRGKNGVGIYSSAHMWSTVCGNLKGGSLTQFPLWYAHYDNKQSFSDFKKFGGWGHAHMKQFNDGPTICGVGVDHNWKP